MSNLNVYRNVEIDVINTLLQKNLSRNYKSNQGLGSRGAKGAEAVDSSRINKKYFLELFMLKNPIFGVILVLCAEEITKGRHYFHGWTLPPPHVTHHRASGSFTAACYL